LNVAESSWYVPPPSNEHVTSRTDIAGGPPRDAGSDVAVSSSAVLDGSRVDVDDADGTTGARDDGGTARKPWVRRLRHASRASRG